MKREHQHTTFGGGHQPPSKTTPTTAKRKLAEPGEDSQDAGVDELLAALGYKVRSSDMSDVARKLDHLDTAMGTNAAGHHHDDTVHYNPSDLSTWLDNMLSEINAPPLPPPTTTTTSQLNRKKTRTSSSSVATHSLRPPPPPILIDPQETGVRLVHTLMACAEAVEQGSYAAAGALLKQVPSLAASQAGAMRKVAGYFAEALGRRVYRSESSSRPDSSGFSDLLHMHFYESCPYLKFAHFTANQAILDAFSGHRRVHVVDLGVGQGMQWPALMQALALRPGGPPSFRLTGFGPPRPDDPDALRRVGRKLAQLADTIHVEFEYRGLVVDSLADIGPGLLGLGGDEDEAVAVNSAFELHGLLGRGAAVDGVLDTVRAMKPKIFTMAEQEASDNAGGFSERFTEALHYYSTMFDSLEGGSEGYRMMTEMYLGREISNVVACEGEERTERHETAAQWKGRLVRAGLEPVCLGSNAFKQASMLLALFFAGGDGYRVEERDGCLTLGWHARPLIVTSAWRPAGQ
ncbi:putative DELLA protein SLR1 [Iris pallida]|uniref:DELLA protein n=1 Tax=Iris pallida TaxID=29817 RepID=A0AAX6I5R0_IRIPA|nr:putative DELLA protein SLR1 [Iris pallida]